MKPVSIIRVLLAAAAIVCFAAQAQDYPASTIHIVVPSAAGATTDALARIVGDRFQKKWGQPVVVEDRAGAGGNIGAEYAFKAAPDGYTLLFSYPAPLVVNKSLYANLQFDPDQFVPVSLAGTAPLVLAVNLKVPATSVQQLISYAKANPGKINYASQGSGTTGHLGAELFNSMVGVRTTHVPYKGSAPAITDLLAGQVDMFFVELPTVLQLIAGGKLRALAVGSEKRSAFLPDVPAMSEVVPGFVALTWFGMVAPPKTPPAVANKLSAALVEAMHDPEVSKKLQSMSLDAIGNTPAEMAQFLKEERERWGKVIRAAGVKQQP